LRKGATGPLVEGRGCAFFGRSGRKISHKTPRFSQRKNWGWDPFSRGLSSTKGKKREKGPKNLFGGWGERVGKEVDSPKKPKAIVGKRPHLNFAGKRKNFPHPVGKSVLCKKGKRTTRCPKKGGGLTGRVSQNPPKGLFLWAVGLAALTKGGGRECSQKCVLTTVLFFYAEEEKEKIL